MATIKVEVTYDPKKETLSQALASLLTEKPEHTETNAQMSLFDTPLRWPAVTVPKRSASSFVCRARNKRLSEVLSEISKISSSSSAYETY